MANNIKGITVNIGGNTQGLDKALKGVNSQAASLQSELREVNRALKLDPTNTELLRQKQELLASSVTETKNKLQTLKQADAQCSEQFKKDHAEQYRALQREIVLTEGNLKQLEAQAEKTNTTLSDVATVSNKIADSAGNISKKMAPATLAIAGIGAVAFNAASEAEDAIGATDQIFKSQSETMQRWADSLETYYGIAGTEALTYANTMGAMLQNIGGLSEAEAAKQSQTLVKLAGDLTAMFGGTTESAIQALTGALKGNTSMLDNYGMAVNETLIKNKAFEMGLVSEGEQLSLAAKQAATLALITEQSSAATGQAAREADGASGSWRAATTELKNTSKEFGEVFMPTITAAIQAVTKAVKAFSDMSNGQKTAIVTVLALVAAISPVAGIVSGAARMVGTLSGALAIFTGAATTGSTAAMGLAKIIAALTSPITWVVAAVVAAVALIAIKGDEIQAVFQGVDTFMQTIFARDWTNILGPVLGGLLNTFFATFKGIWDGVMLIFNGVIDFVRGVFTGDWERAWKGITEIFGGIFGSLDAIAKAPINGIIGLLNMAISAVNSLIRGFNSMGFTMPKWLGGGSWHPNLPSIPSIPFLAKGGTFSQGSAIVGEAGPELLTLIGGAARVTPLTNSQKQIKAAGASFGDINVTVYGQNLGDPKATAKATADELQNEIQRREMVFA
ncbi:phage tail tape measure protein [Pygmaiobacter massiliensis]|uniref:phage tail tape measure protein n=1 Tax=Pygmaiobacter massiliensis TaxID=1917873 RepID=UPI000C7A2D83|nr:phage tail tape measure protein [Pygmaiobacter massiliensis]